MTVKRQAETESVAGDEERQETLDQYMAGEVVEVEENPEQEELLSAASAEPVEGEIPPTSPLPGTSMRQSAEIAGAAAGAVLGGAVASMAGVPVAIAGAAIGAMTGAVAGGALGKEWVRGEAISEAIDFDQPNHQPPGERTTPGNKKDKKAHKHQSHIYSVGTIEPQFEAEKDERVDKRL